MLPILDSDKSQTKKFKEKYLPNKHNIKALDNALSKGFHPLGLQLFLPERQATSLPVGVDRFLVKVSDLPQPIKSCSPGRIFRSCLKMEATGSTQPGPWSFQSMALLERKRDRES